MPTTRCFSCSLICSAAFSCWLSCGAGCPAELCVPEPFCCEPEVLGCEPGLAGEALLCGGAAEPLDVGADPAGGCWASWPGADWGSTAATSIRGVGASGIAYDGEAAAAASAELGPSASRLRERKRKAIPETSRRAAPVKLDRIRSPVFQSQRRPARTAEAPDRLGKVRWNCSCLRGAPAQPPDTTSLIIDNSCYLDALRASKTQKGPFPNTLESIEPMAVCRFFLPVQGLGRIRPRNRYSRVEDRWRRA